MDMMLALLAGAALTTAARNDKSGETKFLSFAIGAISVIAAVVLDYSNLV